MVPPCVAVSDHFVSVLIAGLLDFSDSRGQIACLPLMVMTETTLVCRNLIEEKSHSARPKGGKRAGWPAAQFFMVRVSFEKKPTFMV
jgi:hypothetical protein